MKHRQVCVSAGSLVKLPAKLAAGVLLVLLTGLGADAAQKAGPVAPKPLYRDPVYDGAADPVLVWNRAAKRWWMFYTNRRADAPGLPGVSWVHGTRIGIAICADNSVTWKYRGTANLPVGDANDTHWAPDIVFDEGIYHMFLTFVPGIHNDWSGERRIVHLTSADLVKWKNEGQLPFASDRVLDPSVLRMPDGTWRMWYNDEKAGKTIFLAESPDLKTWTDRGQAIDEKGEGPKAFQWHGSYWLIVDQWEKGLAVYRSDDARNWIKQPEALLVTPGTGPDDQVHGGHADVVVSNDRAFLFYFTHPGRRPGAPKTDTEQRRSSIQVVELQHQDNRLTCDRDRPTHIRLAPPDDGPAAVDSAVRPRPATGRK
jgi:sucrose-6-phosphate hydrolase SacC (GH32 family)